MKKLLLFIILISTQVCNAQNYQCLQAGVKHYFTNSNGYLRGIRIDSVKTYADSVVYYPFHTPRGRYRHGSSVSQLDSTGGSWLGKKAIQLSDGTFIFDSYWNDSVIIKTQANIGDSWILYDDTTSLYYKATCIAMDTMTVLGVVDSIKKIVINAYNSTHIVTTDPIDSFQIILSKNYGFVQVFDLYTFPYHAPDSTFIGELDYYLDLALDMPPYPVPLAFPSYWGPNSINSIFRIVPFTSPKTTDLYQWNLGDVYEYSKCFDYWSSSTTLCNPVQEYDMDTVISSTTSGSSVIYNFSGWKCYLDYPHYAMGTLYYLTSGLTDSIGCDQRRIIDTSLMPEEFLQSYFYYYLPGDSSYCNISPLYAKATNDLAGGSKVSYAIGPDMKVYVYKSPFGLLHYYYAYENIPFSVDDQTLIYYNKGGISCGLYHAPDTNAVPISSIVNIGQSTYAYRLFPNPATDQLTIKTYNINSYTISITNPLGQTITTLHSNKQQETINVSNLPAGVYNVCITDESGGRANEKVVILH